MKIVERGRERHVTRFVALLKVQGDLALKGDLRAMRDVIDLIMRLASDETMLRTSMETAAEDEAILRHHRPEVSDADEPGLGGFDDDADYGHG